MRFKPNNNLEQRGSVLLAFVIMLPFLILIGSYYIDLSVTSFGLAKRGQMQTHAQLGADAGVDYAIQQINQSDSWSGTAGEVEVLPLTNNHRTSFEATVTDSGSNEKTITSTGRSYLGSSSSPQSDITVEVKLRGVQTGAASVVSGVGGMIMRNSAKVVNGAVYINGDLSMSNSSQIGLSILPVDVEVAHQSCPDPATSSYPQVCGVGENGEPISISHTAHIYGDVEARNQSSGTGMSNSGLIDCNESSPGDCPDPVSLPDYNRDAQKAAVSSEQSGASAGCSNGTRTWTNNLKINGSVTVSGTCVVTVQGNVWITGSLEIRNSATVLVANSASTPPVIMIDGSSGIRMRNSSTLASNTSETGFRIITYHNSLSDPDASPSGTSLFSSKDLVTIDLDNSASAPNTELYARWSKLTAGNGGSVGALVAQTVELRNSIAVTFGTSVSGTGDTIWVIDSVKREF